MDFLSLSLTEPDSVRRVFTDLGRRGALAPNMLVLLLAPPGGGPGGTALEIGDVPLDQPQHERVRHFGGFLGHLAGMVTDLALVVSRRGAARAEGDDLGWHDCAAAACAAAGITFHGTYVTTPSGTIGPLAAGGQKAA